jgi:flagellar hook-associated protein 3 FlgL
MSVSGVSSNVAFMTQQLVNLRNQLDDLQQQLSTGQKYQNYSGLPSQAQLLVGLNSQLAAINGFQNSNNVVNARLSIAQTALTQFDSVASGVQNSAMLSNYTAGPNGYTVDQTYAGDQLSQLLNLMNTQGDGGYIFSGNAVNQPSVASSSLILNGTATQAGLLQMISERNQADLGANGLGRLVIPAVTTAPARILGSGATLRPDAPAIASGTQDISGLSSAGGSLVINGTPIAIAAGDNAQTIVSKINLQSGTTKVSASLNASNQLVLTSADANTAVDTTGTSAGLQGELGITAGVTNPTNLVTQGLGGQSLTIQIGANPALTINIGTAPATTLAGVQQVLNTLQGGTATIDPGTGNISITASSPAAGQNITVTGSGPNTAAAFGIGTGLAIPTSGTRVSLSEDTSPSVFGLKIASVKNNLTNANVIGPTGTPPGISVDLTTNPQPNDTLTVTFNLPDGTTQDMTLTATTTQPPPTGTFLIGANPAATAANLQQAMTSSVQTLAATQLTAASAVEAAHNFFDTDAGQPPMRVKGPSFTTATQLVAGTPANTVTWYTGGSGASSAARSSVSARVDSTTTVDYGVQANEQGLRSVIENVAVFAATNFSASNPNSSAAYSALAQRVSLALNVQPGNGTQTTSDIETDLANVQNAIKNTTTQQTQTQATLQDFVQGITGVSNETVASDLLTVQTELQASLQTTAMLSKLSLVNYLSPA